MRHTLKTLPEFYNRVSLGEKNFEIRNNDRDFQKGDIVELAEHNPDTDNTDWPDGFSGRSKIFEVGYVTDWEQQAGYVVFSLIPIPKSKIYETS